MDRRRPRGGKGWAMRMVKIQCLGTMLRPQTADGMEEKAENRGEISIMVRGTFTFDSSRHFCLIPGSDGGNGHSGMLHGTLCHQTRYLIWICMK